MILRTKFTISGAIKLIISLYFCFGKLFRYVFRKYLDFFNLILCNIILCQVPQIGITYFCICQFIYFISNIIRYSPKP